MAAGFISKTLLRHAMKGTATSPCITLVPHRHRSSQPSKRKHKPKLIEIDGDEYKVAHKVFDDLIQRILVEKSTPDWLPFLPGSSFWVPPSNVNVNVIQFIHKHNLPDDLSHDHSLSLSLATLRTCPTSEFFIQPQENEFAHDGDAGVEVNNPEGMEVTLQVKVLTTSENVAHSEDEEG